MTHPDAQRAFEEYWTEDGRNLCKSPLGSFEARMHKRTWDAATERAAKVCEDEAGAAGFVGILGAQLAAERIAAAIRGTK